MYHKNNDDDDKRKKISRGEDFQNLRSLEKIKFPSLAKFKQKILKIIKLSSLEK